VYHLCNRFTPNKICDIIYNYTMEREDMPIGFGYDPCDDVVHWLDWIREDLKNRNAPNNMYALTV